MLLLRAIPPMYAQSRACISSRIAATRFLVEKTKWCNEQISSLIGHRAVIVASAVPGGTSILLQPSRQFLPGYFHACLAALIVSIQIFGGFLRSFFITRLKGIWDD